MSDAELPAANAVMPMMEQEPAGHFAHPAFCAACRLRRVDCVCVHAPHLNISTRLIVIIHSKEWHKSTNTGHFARLAIKGAEVRLHGARMKQVSSAGVESTSSSTLALYPGQGAKPLTAEYIASLARPVTLLVPDGNWNQAQNMMRRLPLLRQARPVRLEGPTLNLDCLRHNRCADRMSTFEALAQALGILESAETERDLLKFFRQVLERLPHN